MPRNWNSLLLDWTTNLLLLNLYTRISNEKIIQYWIYVFDNDEGDDDTGEY